MPKPRHWWALRPGPERQRRKAEHGRYYDKLDSFRRLCRGWQIDLEGVPLDVKDEGTIVLCHTSVVMPTSASIVRIIVDSYVRTHSQSHPDPRSL